MKLAEIADWKVECESNEGEYNMKIIFGLFFYHLLLVGLGLYARFWRDNSLYEFNSLWMDVGLFGLTGGCTYCIRSLYLQYCVKQEWDNKWVVWHVVRPFVSTVCGVVSLVFVKSGLLMLEASSIETQSHYGIYALAFIAGLNVDNFIKKIESIFKVIAGIQETRASGEK